MQDEVVEIHGFARIQRPNRKPLRVNGFDPVGLEHQRVAPNGNAVPVGQRHSPNWTFIDDHAIFTPEILDEIMLALLDDPGMTPRDGTVRKVDVVHDAARGMVATDVDLLSIENKQFL